MGSGVTCSGIGYWERFANWLVGFARSRPETEMSKSPSSVRWSSRITWGINPGCMVMFGISARGRCQHYNRTKKTRAVNQSARISTLPTFSFIWPWNKLYFSCSNLEDKMFPFQRQAALYAIDRTPLTAAGEKKSKPYQLSLTWGPDSCDAVSEGKSCIESALRRVCAVYTCIRLVHQLSVRQLIFWTHPIMVQYAWKKASVLMPRLAIRWKPAYITPNMNVMHIFPRVQSFF